MVLGKLAISNLLVRKARSALTVAAIALSVSLVVAVTSGYKSMESAALRYLNQYMGAADAFIMPANDYQGKVPEALVKQLTDDPDVRQASGRLESQVRLPRVKAGEHGAAGRADRPDHTDIGGTPLDEVNVQLLGIRRPGDTQSQTLEMSAGQWFDGGDGDVAVLDQAGADKIGVKLGEEIELPGLHETNLKLKVVGLVHKPTFFAERSTTIYMPLETLQRFTGQDQPAMVSRIYIDLRANADFEGFKKRWTDRLAAMDTNLKLRMRRENAGELEKNLRSVHILSYLGGAVSMVTAMFIIFSSLSMGVTERQRSLAMLRAIGCTRGQVGRLVLIEGILFAIVGCVVGIPLGIAWTELLCLRFKDLFSAGASFSMGGMVFASGVSIFTALAASLMPAWTASRMSPMEAMNAHAMVHAANRPPVWWAVLGLALAAIDPIIFFGPVEKVLSALHVTNAEARAQTVRFQGHFFLGLPGVIIGFFLLAPMIVWLLERALAPVLARIFVLPSRLLRQQLSGGMWRSAGTAAALMVGLATLIAMQAHGETLIGGWRLPDKFPDIFIFGPNIISWQDQEKLAKVPGIAPGSLMPCVVTTPTGDSKQDVLIATALAGSKSSVMFFAVYPEQALGMVELEFRDNDGKPFPRDQQAGIQAAVAKEMEKGRRIIVTDEFRQAKHLKIGDTFNLLTSKKGMQPYIICGIVWSPGVDVVISMFDLGHMLDQQTAGSVFGSIEDAKRDFGVTGTRMFAANLEGGIDKEKLLKNVQKALGERGLSAGDVRHIKYNIEKAFYRLLLLISSVAFAAMAVASLGVANTVMASVRTRRWQFGVLRSIGVARGQLLRLVLAEAVLLGLVGVALGLAAGLEMAVDARQLGGVSIGYSPPLVIPWGMVGIGCAAVLFVSLAASLWPAIVVARTEILGLLQAGRSSS